MNWVYLLAIIFATSSGLVLVYTLVSSCMLFASMSYLSRGEEFRKLVGTLFTTTFIGFLYAFWNLMVQLRVLDGNDLKISFVGSILVSLFFVMLAYLGFYTKQLSKKFGFQVYAKGVVPQLKPVRKRKR